MFQLNASLCVINLVDPPHAFFSKYQLAKANLQSQAALFLDCLYIQRQIPKFKLYVRNIAVMQHLKLNSNNEPARHFPVNNDKLRLITFNSTT